MYVFINFRISQGLLERQRPGSVAERGSGLGRFAAKEMFGSCQVFIFPFGTTPVETEVVFGDNF